MKELEIFGKKFRCLKYYRVEIGKIKDDEIEMLYSMFVNAFPDHPSKENVVLYLLEKEDSRDLLWTCSHFEHGNVGDIAALSWFMNNLSYLSEFKTAFVELLDNFAECIIIKVPNVYSDIVGLLKRM